MKYLLVKVIEAESMTYKEFDLYNSVNNARNLPDSETQGYTIQSQDRKFYWLSNEDFLNNTISIKNIENKIFPDKLLDSMGLTLGMVWKTNQMIFTKRLLNALIDWIK